MNLNSPEFSRLLSPRAVAVVGASSDPHRNGSQPLRVLTQCGFAGQIYPVDREHSVLAGIDCYPDLASVPKPCDVALIAVEARHVAGAIRQCSQARIPFAIVLSAGFREIGAEGVAREQDLKAAIAASGVRVLGPNCIGIMNVPGRACLGFGPGFRNPHLRTGPVALVSQRGGLAFGVAELVGAQGIGFRYIVSTGHEADLGTLDFLDHFLDRDDIEVIVTCIERVADGSRLRAIGRKALTKRKPILVWKAGNSASGRDAAASHTAAMTADYALYRAAFREGGFVEVRDCDDLADAIRALAGRKLPRGNRVAILTTSGGAGVLMADRCDEEGLVLPPLQPGTLEQLRAFMPPRSVFANPADFTAELFDDYPRFNAGLRIVLDDPNADQVIVRYGAVQDSNSSAWAQDLARACATTEKPVLVVWGQPPDPEAQSLAILAEHRIPWCLTPARTAHAAGVLHHFAAKIASLRRAHVARPLARAEVDLPAGAATLDAQRSKRLLAAYGIPVANEASMAHEHNLDSRRDAVVAGEMHGLACVLSAVCDPCFGPVVSFGVGGITTELFHDLAHRFAPFDVQTGREMIDEIHLAPLFKGYRGRPALDVHALASALSRLSFLIADHGDRIARIDVDPLFVRPEGEGVVAAGALVLTRSALALSASGGEQPAAS